MTLAEVNALPKERFVAALGGVFEHSPWVAERVAGERPIVGVDALHAAMLSAVHGANDAEKLALIRAHPELAGREASDGALTADSATEQGRLGFTALSHDEFQRIAALNRRYREKFGIPCIVALRLHASRATVLAEMERRTGSSRDAELAAALEQIGHIARGRLDKLVRP